MHTWFFIPIFVLMSACFLFIGIKVATSRRPLFIPSRLFLAFIVIGFLPQFVMSFHIFVRNPAISSKLLPMNILILLMYICLFTFLWFQMKGYTAIGISDDTFRTALHSSLDKQGFPFEEQLSTIKLISENTYLQIAIQSWVGAGQIKLKKSNKKDLLKNIISGLNDYYLQNNIRPNNVTSIFYIAMGTIMLVFACVFLFVI
jgi:hypothetical protein